MTGLDSLIVFLLIVVLVSGSLGGLVAWWIHRWIQKLRYNAMKLPLMALALSVLPIVAIRLADQPNIRILREQGPYTAEGAQAENNQFFLALLLGSYLFFVLPVWISLIVSTVVRGRREMKMHLGD